MGHLCFNCRNFSIILTLLFVGLWGCAKSDAVEDSADAGQPDSNTGDDDDDNDDDNDNDDNNDNNDDDNNNDDNNDDDNDDNDDNNNNDDDNNDDDNDDNDDNGDDDDDDVEPPFCGNGFTEEGEDCDGWDLDNEDCLSLGFIGGELACRDSCRFDKSKCCSVLPTPDQDWLAAYQDEIVAKLTGYLEISPGQRLESRHGESERQLVREYLFNLWWDLRYRPQEQVYATGSNVYAELKSNYDSDEYVIYGAHFDSVVGSPGASDNASGIAALMALSRYAKMVDCRERNILFVGFDEKESDLAGSTEFVSFLLEANYKVHSMHNLDMVSWDKDGDGVVEVASLSPALDELYYNVVQNSEFDIPLASSELGEFDHQPFHDAGIPAVMLIEEFSFGDRSDFYHQPGDVYETVVPYFSFLKQVTVLAALGMIELVRRDLSGFWLTDSPGSHRLGSNTRRLDTRAPLPQLAQTERCRAARRCCSRAANH